MRVKPIAEKIHALVWVISGITSHWLAWNGWRKSPLKSLLFKIKSIVTDLSPVTQLFISYTLVCTCTSLLCIFTDHSCEWMVGIWYPELQGIDWAYDQLSFQFYAWLAGVVSSLDTAGEGLTEQRWHLTSHDMSSCIIALVHLTHTFDIPHRQALSHSKRASVRVPSNGFYCTTFLRISTFIFITCILHAFNLQHDDISIRKYFYAP